MKHLQASRVNLMIKDMEASLTFYTEILEFDLVNRWGDHYAEIKAADLMIALHPTENDLVVGNASSIGFGVTDFDESVKDLRSKGIVIDLVQDGYVRLANFSDPDGNLLFLAERK